MMENGWKAPLYIVIQIIIIEQKNILMYIKFVFFFHIKVKLPKETEEEHKEMQMATQQLLNMGIINPKDTPTFFANKNLI